MKWKKIQRKLWTELILKRLPIRLKTKLRTGLRTNLDLILINISHQKKLKLQLLFQPQFNNKFQLTPLLHVEKMRPRICLDLIDALLTVSATAREPAHNGDGAKARVDVHQELRIASSMRPRIDGASLDVPMTTTVKAKEPALDGDGAKVLVDASLFTRNSWLIKCKSSKWNSCNEYKIHCEF